MQELNEYGNLSGGFICDFLDREAHKIAKKKLGTDKTPCHCETISLSIDYMGKIDLKDLKDYTYYSTYPVGDNKVHINTNTKGKVFGKFIFIKRKEGLKQ